MVAAKSKPGHHDTAATATTATKKADPKPVLQEKSGPTKSVKSTSAASKPPAAAKQDKSAAAARKVDVKSKLVYV